MYIQFISWNESQTQVIHALNMIISYLQRSNVLWCPTLVLLSQTCFLLLLSGSYGYDRSCWFQAKMIINIRNELPSSCLGSLHQNDLCPEWSNARNGIKMTKSRTSFNKQLLRYWVFIKGMYRWRGFLCLFSSDGQHEQGKFMRIESLVPNVSVNEPNVFSFITVW